MPKYFYIDKNTGRLKKYVGKIEERDGKLFGILVTPKTNYSESKLHKVESGKEIKSCETHIMWKDSTGQEHELSDSDIVKDNYVIYKSEQSFDVIFHPEVQEETYFRTPDGSNFTGEIIERNDKFFGKL